MTDNLPLITFLTLIVSIVWGSVQRYWVEQDRKRTAIALEKERQLTAAGALKSLDDRAAEIRQDLTNRGAELSLSLAHNTRLTQEAVDNAKEAYHEANNLNLKIVAAGEGNAEALTQLVRSLEQARSPADKEP